MLPPVQHGPPLRADATLSARSERVVTRNFMALGAGEAASRLIAFTATVYIAHRLGLLVGCQPSSLLSYPPDCSAAPKCTASEGNSGPVAESLP